MKFKLKATVAALAMMAAGGANAAINTGTALQGAGQGELFFSVFDSIGQVSYSRDLGVSINNFMANPNGSMTVTADAKLQTFLTNAGSNPLVWNLLGAADLDFGSALPADYPSFGLYMTSKQGDAAVAGIDFAQAYSGMGTLSSFAQGINGDALNQGGGTMTNYALNNSSTSTAGSGYYGGLFGGNNLGGNIVASDEANIGESMAFYHIGMTLDGNGMPVLDSSDNPIAFMTKFGNWTLAANGDLSYGVAGNPAPVPLPPAVWLLGSALAGLVGVARRNRQQEEALTA